MSCTYQQNIKGRIKWAEIEIEKLEGDKKNYLEYIKRLKGELND